MSSIVLTDFVLSRLFDADVPGTTILGTSPQDFERALNDRTPLKLLDGYAPFCKLHVHENWTETRAGAVEITSRNKKHLCSGYERRTPDELAVLSRWFEGIEAPVAAYLLAILYDRQQLAKEREAITAPWGVVGILATMSPEEPPMTPITMMRNALGVEEGGSGVALDREAYLRSVEYWSRHANVRSG